MPLPLLVPSEIPFARLKGRDLEECVYWLIDSLGGKELEWRQGGTGGGAADGGRDLEAHFLIPGPDGEVSRQRWWIEVKGRSGTVEPSVVRDAVSTARGRADLDVLIIATNSVFSNPTRDWLAEWQKSEPHLRVKLWDQQQLERLLTQHPEVAIRLFSRALSPQGKLEVVQSRFWNHSTYAGAPLLDELWEQREKLQFTDRALLAVVMSECANGDVGAHPWATILNDSQRLALFEVALRHAMYFCSRADDAGVSQEGYLRGTAYLLLASLELLDIAKVMDGIERAWSDLRDARASTVIGKYTIGVVVSTLSHELLRACTSDCQRISPDWMEPSERTLGTYWDRFLPPRNGRAKSPPGGLIIEDGRKPCNAGLPLSTTQFCPLTHLERDEEKLDVRATLEVLQAVVRGRLLRLVNGTSISRLVGQDREGADSKRTSRTGKRRASARRKRRGGS
jgi:hypothetical protein